MTRSSRAVTLRDVAEAVGVHAGTASRALSAGTRAMVAPETVARVLRAAEELGYQPNSAARSLRTARSLTIGVVVPDLANPLFPPIVRGIEDVLAEAGFTVFVTNTDNDPRRESRAIASLRARQVDGLIVATGRRDTKDLAALAALLPIVTVTKTMLRAACSSVRGDDREGVRSVVAHLRDLGHRRVAEIAGPSNLSVAVTRHRVFVEAARSSGFVDRPGWRVITKALTEEEGRRAVPLILTAGCPTAIVAANDLLALGAIEALRDAGLTVPDDVSVTGFNDMKLVDKLTPSLTTVHLDKLAMGREAARLMLDRLDQPDTPPEHVVLPCRLVIRGSTGLAVAVLQSKA